MRGEAQRVAVALVAAGFSLLQGCATFPPPREAIPASRSYGNVYNDVWEAVLGSLAEMKLSVKSMEKESGTIVAEDAGVELRQFDLDRYDSPYCFCGVPGQGHVFRGLVGEHTIHVTRVNDNRTAVTIDASFRTSRVAGDLPAGSVPCPSKGIFEPLFLERVDSQLSARKTPARSIDWWKPTRGY